MEKIKGKFSNKFYYANEAIRILDPMQAALYWANGVEPLDIYSSRDYKTNKQMNIEDIINMKDKWCKHELS